MSIFVICQEKVCTAKHYLVCPKVAITVLEKKHREDYSMH